MRDGRLIHDELHGGARMSAHARALGPRSARRRRGTSGAGAGIPRSRLLAADVLRVASVGLRTRRLRAALSALGVAIGIAAMVAVLGISESSKAGLVAELNELGTNLLTVAPGQTFLGANAQLPEAAVASVRNLASVRSAAAVTTSRRATRAAQPLHRSRRNGRHRGRGRRPRAARHARREAGPRGASSKPPTNATRWSCSARSPRSASG